MTARAAGHRPQLSFGARLRRLGQRLGWSRSHSAGAPIATYPSLVVCEECDAIYARPALSGGGVARCARCGSTLARGHWLSIDGQLALALAALIVFVIGNVAPIVTLDLRGIRSVATLPEAIESTWRNGEPLVALLAFGTAFAFPLAVIVLRLWVLAPLAAGRRAAGFVPAMRALRWVTRWSMVEVFLLGALVAIVRSAGLTYLVTGAGLFAIVALTLLLTAMQASGLDGVWQHAAELPA